MCWGNSTTPTIRKLTRDQVLVQFLVCDLVGMFGVLVCVCVRVWCGVLGAFKVPTTVCKTPMTFYDLRRPIWLRSRSVESPRTSIWIQRWLKHAWVQSNTLSIHMPKGYSLLKPGVRQKSQNKPARLRRNVRLTSRRRWHQGSRAQLTLRWRRTSWRRNGFLFQNGGFRSRSRCSFSVLKPLFTGTYSAKPLLLRLQPLHLRIKDYTQKNKEKMWLVWNHLPLYV